MRRRSDVFTGGYDASFGNALVLGQYINHDPVWLAENSAGGGQIVQLHELYNHLSQEGKKHGYLVHGSTSWLIVKSDVLVDEAKRVFGDDVNITSEGQRYLEAVIGSQEFKDQYCREKVLGWKGERSTISDSKEPASCSLHCFDEEL